MTQSIAREPKTHAPAGKTREFTQELFLKSEQLLRFRIAFALVSLCLCVGIYSFAGEEFQFAPAAGIIFGVAVYSFVGIAFVVKSLKNSSYKLKLFNNALLLFDILSITALVHFTRGLESDLYVLYMLPIILASYTLGTRGVYTVAGLVTVFYVGLLAWESLPLLEFLFKGEGRGIASAIALKMWRRIFARAFFFACVSFLWARFCDYLNRVARRSNERLVEQLEANERLVAESEERAQRERMINSINKGVRSTLELDRIVAAAVDQLSQAVPADLVAILCPPAGHTTGGALTADKPPLYVESVAQHTKADLTQDTLSLELKSFILTRRAKYERNDATSVKTKTFISRSPARDPFYANVRDELKALGYETLVIQPMMYGEESKGAVILADRKLDRDFSDTELVLTKVVAGQVAVAIEHANLVTELSSKNEDLVSKNSNLDAKNIELKTMQSQLIHQEKMASLGRLVAGIAHELNNPINFVHGNLPYLKQYVDELKRLVDAASELPESERKPFDDLKSHLKYDYLVSDLDNIIADLNEGSGRIRHIIRDLKSFSRLDEAELKDASIQEGIESTLKILSQYYGRDKIPVDARYGDSPGGDKQGGDGPNGDGPNGNGLNGNGSDGDRQSGGGLPQVLCYPGQLNQVWMNILSNAAQAMQDVEKPVLKVNARQEGESILVEITDCGGGIKPEVRSKIFDPFFTTKPVGQGTGLGLSICHSIIERHGGQIWFTSEMGKGTTFFIRVPLTAARQTDD